MKLCVRCKLNETPPGFRRCAECRSTLEAKRRASIDARVIRKRSNNNDKHKSKSIKIRVDIYPEPFIGGRFKRQWRKLRGLIAGLEVDSPWITLILPESRDVPLVRTIIHTLKYHARRCGSRRLGTHRYVYPYRDFVYETRTDSAQANCLHVRRK